MPPCGTALKSRAPNCAPLSAVTGSLKAPIAPGVDLPEPGNPPPPGECAPNRPVPGPDGAHPAAEIGRACTVRMLSGKCEISQPGGRRLAKFFSPWSCASSFPAPRSGIPSAGTAPPPPIHPSPFRGPAPLRGPGPLGNPAPQSPVALRGERRRRRRRNPARPPPPAALRWFSSPSPQSPSPRLFHSWESARTALHGGNPPWPSPPPHRWAG